MDSYIDRIRSKNSWDCNCVLCILSGLPRDGGALPARVCGQCRGADDGGDRWHLVPPLPLRGHQAPDTRVSWHQSSFHLMSWQSISASRPTSPARWRRLAGAQYGRPRTLSPWSTWWEEGGESFKWNLICFLFLERSSHVKFEFLCLELQWNGESWISW